LISGALSSEKF